MTLTRWDPFKDLLRIQERMNRMFEDSMVLSQGDRKPGSGRVGWTPTVDIFETPEDIVLVADLPGLAPDSLDVHVEGNSLILAGERRLDEEVQEENFHRMERGYGLFRRSFTLPATIRQDGIRAEHHNGVLRVRLPKAESMGPKKIQVENPS